METTKQNPDEIPKELSTMNIPVSSSVRFLRSFSSNTDKARENFTNDCTSNLTSDLGQDGLVSTFDFALYLSTLSDESMDFHNLPTFVQYKFVSLLCDGKDKDDCTGKTVSKKRERENIGFTLNEFDKINELCFDIYFYLKSIGWADAFDVPTNVPSRLQSYPPSLNTIQPSITSPLPASSPTVFPSTGQFEHSNDPTMSPSTQLLTDIPTHIESNLPTSLPLPSMYPSIQPSEISSTLPSAQISTQPSTHISANPSLEHSMDPSMQSSIEPSTQTSSIPSTKHSIEPSIQSSIKPSIRPSTSSTMLPSTYPSIKATTTPSSVASTKPSSSTFNTPTVVASNPSMSILTEMPSEFSSNSPVISSSFPTVSPTTLLSNNPSDIQSNAPSLKSHSPTFSHSSSPTINKSTTPSQTSQDSLFFFPPTLAPTFIPEIPIKAPSSLDIVESPLLDANFVSSSAPSLAPSVESIRLSFVQQNEKLNAGNRLGLAGILVASCFVFASLFLVAKRRNKDYSQLISSRSNLFGRGNTGQYFNFECVSIGSEFSGNPDSMELNITTISKENLKNNENWDVDGFDDFIDEEGNPIPQFNPSLAFSVSSQSSYSSGTSASSKATLPSSRPTAMQKIKSALREMNETIGFFDAPSVSKIAEDVSSASDDLSSLSSRQSSQLQGEHIEQIPTLLATSLPTVYPSPQNVPEEDRRQFINNLIATGHWEEVAAESALYQSEASTVSSNAILSVSTGSQEIKREKARPFLDYVLGKHTLASMAASAVINTDHVNEYNKKIPVNSAPLGVQKSTTPLALHSPSSNKSSNPASQESIRSSSHGHDLMKYFKNKDEMDFNDENSHKRSGFWNEKVVADLDIDDSKMTYISSAGSSPAESLVSSNNDLERLETTPIDLNSMFREVENTKTSNEVSKTKNVTRCNIPPARNQKDMSPLPGKTLEMEFHYVGSTRMVMEKKESPGNWEGCEASKVNVAQDQQQMKSALSTPASTKSVGNPLNTTFENQLHLQDNLKSKPQHELTRRSPNDDKISMPPISKSDENLATSVDAISQPSELVSSGNSLPSYIEIENLSPIYVSAETADGRKDIDLEEKKEHLSKAFNPLKLNDKASRGLTSNQLTPSTLKDFVANQVVSSIEDGDVKQGRNLNNKRLNHISPFRERKIIYDPSGTKHHSGIELNPLNLIRNDSNGESSIKDDLDRAIEKCDWDAVEKYTMNMMELSNSSDPSEKYSTQDESSLSGTSAVTSDLSNLEGKEVEFPTVTESINESITQDKKSVSDTSTVTGDSINLEVDEKALDERIETLERLIESDDWKGLGSPCNNVEKDLILKPSNSNPEK